MKNQKEGKVKIFDKYFDEHNLDKTSQYNDFSKKSLVVEAECIYSALLGILSYLDEGGKDLNIIRDKVMAGIYESRI